jgi:tetratricopeptide (TPR) repeat protein
MSLPFQSSFLRTPAPILAVAALCLLPGALRAQESPITALPEGLDSPAPVPTLKDGKTDIGAAARLGAAAFAKGDWEAARDSYRKMVNSEPDNALALSNLAAAEYQLRDFEPAQLHFEQALKADPNLVESWIALGLIHFQQEAWYGAISSFTQALRLQEDNARAHRYLALTAWKIGWSAAAELELQRAVELNPKDADAHFNLALMYLERSEPAVELARRHYYRATDLGAEPDLEIEARIKEENR